MAADPRRVKELFAAALDIPAGPARQEFLERECANDAELRGRLEALLDAHDRPQPVLDRPLAAHADDDEEKPGAVLAGKYKLVEHIGEGGMGTVWMAQQTEPVRRAVAVKLIKDGGDSHSVLARFEAERQALALMDHPNIAKVLDAGATPRGAPFFVMELVKGVPITRFCDERRLTPRQRLELFVPVCQAIQHAHHKGVIHRDIKPSNVLVALYDDRPVPKVIDFGLAKAAGPQLTDHTLLTGFGALVGTPQYMSPEQATLNNLDIDTRSDIYSLGALLYELLAGSPPFRRKELERAGVLEVLRAIREDEPPRPSDRVSTAEALPGLAASRNTEPAKLTRVLRGEIDWIVMKALEKERSRRYETAAGFALDVQRYLADEPVQAGPPGAAYRLKKFVSRNRGRATAAALVLLALVAGVVGTALGLVRAEAAKRAEARRAEGERLARLDAQEAAEGERQAKLAAQKAAEGEKRARVQAQKQLKQIEKGAAILAWVFHDLDPRSGGRSEESLRVLLGRRLGEAVKQLEGETVGDPLLVARLQSQLGRSLRELGHYKQAEAVLTKARRTQEGSLGAHHPDTLHTLGDLADVYHYQGKPAQAEALYKEVLGVQIARQEANHPDTLTTKNNLAMLYFSLGKYPQAEALYKEVLEVQTSTLGADHPYTLTTRNNLASLYKSQGKYSQAQTLYREVLEGSIARKGADHPDTLTAKNNLAELYHSLGRYAQAETLYKEALAGRTARQGADHPYTLASKSNLAALYRSRGQLAQAEAMYKEVLGVQTALQGAEHLDTLATKHNLAELYHSRGKYTQAEALYRETLAGRIARQGAAHPNTLKTKHNLAVLYWSLKRLDRSVPLFEEVVGQYTKQLGAGHPETILAVANLGVNYCDAGRVDDGIRCLEEAITAIRRIPGPVPAQLAPIPSSLAQAYDRAKKYAKSEPLYREFLEQGRRQFGADDPRTAGLMAQLALNLLSQDRHAEAEKALRDCLAIRDKMQPNAWWTFNTKSMLGEALLGQKKYAEAGPLLKGGYRGMKQRQDQIPAVVRQLRLTEALRRLVALSEATGDKEAAAKCARSWRL